MKRELSFLDFLFVACLIISVALSAISTALPAASASGRPKRSSSLSSYQIKASTNSSDRAFDKEGLYSAAQVDTYVIGEYNFDTGGYSDPQGWFGVDWTAQVGTFFHVDSFRVIGGVKSLWCGLRARVDSLFCNYATLPGYGNRWDQFFESRSFPTQGDVTVSFKAI
jgi:hypothetical protein